MKIVELIEKYRDASIDQQRVPWNRELWEKVWAVEGARLPGRAALDFIDEEFADHKTIRRSWLRELADGDPVEFLVAVSAWGFGNFNRGPYSLRLMLGENRSGEEVRSVVASIISAARTGPAEGFRALFDGHGRTRIPRLGIAYGTKVVHFAGYRDADLKPLILDKWVWTASTQLDPRPKIRNPRGYMKGREYEDYCRWAGQVAADTNVEPALVEYALFDYGKSQLR